MKKKAKKTKAVRTKKLEIQGRPFSWMGGPESLRTGKKERTKRQRVGIMHILVKVTCKGTREVRYWLGKENLIPSLRERYEVQIVK